MELTVVLCTVPDVETGARIARAIVEERIAACVNVVPGLRSIYRWKGEVQDEPEALLVIKARAQGFERLAERISSLHPYEVPEIVALEVSGCHGPYLAWALDATG